MGRTQRVPSIKVPLLPRSCAAWGCNEQQRESERARRPSSRATALSTRRKQQPPSWEDMNPRETFSGDTRSGLLVIDIEEPSQVQLDRINAGTAVHMFGRPSSSMSQARPIGLGAWQADQISQSRLRGVVGRDVEVAGAGSQNSAYRTMQRTASESGRSWVGDTLPMSQSMAMEALWTGRQSRNIAASAGGNNRKKPVF